ncbi:hypothetical protein GGR65_000047 [Xanthomonas sp. 3376]|nr:hypothetical protein [Xanthomonas arboricola]
MALRPTSARLPWQTRRHAPVRVTRRLAADAWRYSPPNPRSAPVARRQCLIPQLVNRTLPRSALAARALADTRAHGAQAVSARPHGRRALIRRPKRQTTSHHSLNASKAMTANGRGSSVAGDWRKAAHGCAAAASQTGCLTEPSSRSPAALLPPTEAAKRQARPRLWRASCACSPRRERGFRRPEHEKKSHHSPTASKVMTANGRGSSAAGDWRKAAQGCAAAVSQTGGLTEPSSRSPAALLPPTEAAKRQARPRSWRASCACLSRRERNFRRPEHEKTSHHSPTASKVMTANGRGCSVAGDWRKAAQGCAAAASQTGCLTEPGSRSPAALLPPTEAGN